MHGLGRYVSADGTVFEGNFIADERDGPRVVIYPDGRRYASTWSTGKHISPPGAPASAKPYLMLGVDVRRYALDGDIFTRDERGEDDLTYLGRFAAGDFVIESDWPFWVAWSKGGPVVIGEGGFEDFESESFPCFSTSASSTRPREKLVIRKAEAVVEESVPDFEPILRLHDASRIYGGVTCGIVNFGWGRVDDCEVAFNILPRDAEPKFENYQFVEKVEPFSERATFSLARAMEALGMDVDAIAAIEHLKEDDDPARESVAVRATREMRRFPKFVKLDDDVFSAYGLIAGEVRIAWTDHSGSKQAKRVKFQLSKCFSMFWPEFGSGGSSSGKYDLLLETEGKDYVVPFAYKRTLAPGANDRFTLQIASQVSTYQQFRIRLTTAEGREIISPRCRMHFLVPRTFSWREGYLIEKEPL